MRAIVFGGLVCNSIVQLYSAIKTRPQDAADKKCHKIDKNWVISSQTFCNA